MEKLVYTVPELAKVLGIGRNAAYDLVQRKDFTAVRVSERRVVVPCDRLKIWLERQANNGICGG